MGSMKRVRYPAGKMSATPALGLVFLLLAGCSGGSPIEGKSVADWEQQLRGGDAISAAQAALALSKLGSAAAPATSALVESLMHSNTLVRQNAALALGAIGSQARSAVNPLAAALADGDWQVRRQAAVALGQIGPDAREATPALQKAANDKNSLVQKAAKEALKRVGTN